MPFEVTIPFWALTLSYWIHLIATVIWLGGLALMALVAWPALRTDVIDTNQWVNLQQRFTPWANASLVILWVTGLLQMSANSNYDGFLSINSLWAQAILIKHIAVAGMMVFGLYAQWRIHPALARLFLLESKQPDRAAQERDNLVKRENRLVVLSLVCAVAVLLFTAVATAI